MYSNSFLVYFLMYFVFVRTCTIESGNSNLLKLKREMYLKFQIAKGKVSPKPGYGELGMEPEIKCHWTHSSFLLS